MIVETWSDVVCPWCFIGKRRMESVLHSMDLQPELLHRAFQLDPTAQTQGRRTVDVLSAKYRVDATEAEAMMARVTEVARSEGLDFHLLDTESGNTADAHRLVLWVQDVYGPVAAQAVLDVLMTAYFCEALPIFTPEQLLPLAASVDIGDGRTIDPVLSAALLEGTDLGARVAHDQREAAELGATGVPFFVIDRRFGIAGAQPREVFEETLQRAAEG